MSILRSFLGIMLFLCCFCLAPICSAQIPNKWKIKVKKPNMVIKKEAVLQVEKPVYNVSKEVGNSLEIQQIPDELRLNSVCVINNTNNCPIVIRVQLSAAVQHTEVLYPLKKSYVSIPKGTASPIVFSFEGAENKNLRFECALERGNFYQVFMSQVKDKLAVAKVATP